jgi:hypothetical protein
LILTAANDLRLETIKGSAERGVSGRTSGVMGWVKAPAVEPNNLGDRP